ncbi:fructosamine kinase family protein [Catellatospora sp. KI3]|uniref:fructosamine kinase family protein n=1 Tax=Catellatospora sp. KI3 TaxID=3041620 RepID=UPI0024832734|nr:fructosamine kinase family protein [Catellatospora sp. KI3]MDI1461601.1 fructosamine kinase family protein [Catellatospora sp. KI3]
MTEVARLARRLGEAGFAVREVAAAGGGVIATAGLATLDDGRVVFAKTADAAGGDLFEVEAAGLRELRDVGGAATPEVLLVAEDLLVLAAQRPRPDGPLFWERLGHLVARLHTGAVGERHGWHRDGWLGRLRQDNTWHDDGYAFFAQRRILRWLPEPLVRAAFDDADRAALERLCAALPQLVPPQPAALTHGDLWAGNVVADDLGRPVLIDPAVSYTWPEVDLGMLWCSPPVPGKDRFFDAYGEIAPLRDGWRDRMELMFLREALSVIAHGDDDWGAADLVRRVAAPFRTR